MTPDAPDRDPTMPPPSLALRAFGWARARARRPVAPVDKAAEAVAAGSWIVPALALLVAAGPIATLAGATLLAGRAQRETAAAEAALAPRYAADQARGAARTMLGAAIVQPGPAALLDTLSTALPADAALMRAERQADGTLELEVAVSDPDALRTALRRVPALAGLRDVRQQEGEGRTMVVLRQAAR
ncbi:hypothetical protein S2M10_23260 [Sphingomonas sp. S2M10]|uniref:hypothetical protein n=1 Tax=Sphingomonas sp. S2M10 TaxID=2705010 RepID=UPI0014567425|nr:hypothetical protein [Sphingomonas sp. S2M10]NLS27331.1 hypothetical protein [Sphingomonas sp. S2M10]